jgi:hypothetical protein
MKAGINFITGNGNAAAKINVINNGFGGGDIALITRLNGFDSERLRILADNGNVGVGTNTPQSKLELRNDQPNISDNYILTISNNGTPTQGMKAGINLVTGNGSAAAKINVINNGSAGGDIAFLTRLSGLDSERFRILANNGNVGIGTTIPDEKLTVKGKIHAEEIKVDLNVPGPDYVFEKDYDLKSLPQIEKYISENKHLPEIPSAKTMEKDGINIGKMQMKLLQKIEELTLHLIEQDKKNAAQQKEIEELRAKLK